MFLLKTRLGYKKEGARKHERSHSIPRSLHSNVSRYNCVGRYAAGKQIYDSLNAPETDYPVFGIPATTLISAIFNGAIYGTVAWLIFTSAEKARKPAA